MAREQFVEDGSQTENVRPVIGLETSHLLGCHVAHRPEHGSGSGSGPRGHCHRRRLGVRQRLELGQTEVEDLDPALAIHNHVGRFHVPMHDTFIVGRCQAIGDLATIVDGLALGNAASTDQVLQGVAIQQFRDRESHRSFPTEIVNREDVGVRQGGYCLGFSLEAGQAIGILGQVCRQHLDGDLPIEPLVPRSIDLAHPTRTQRRQDLVRPESAAWF